MSPDLKRRSPACIAIAIDPWNPEPLLGKSCALRLQNAGEEARGSRRQVPSPSRQSALSPRKQAVATSCRFSPQSGGIFHPFEVMLMRVR